MTRKYATAFTLAEMLICLMIVGEIATFTIPKVIASQQNSQFLSSCKEDLAAVYTAYYQHKITGQLTTGTKMLDLTPYLNYIKLVTNSSLTTDQAPTIANLACDSSYPCIIMHNGSAIHFDALETFGGSAISNVLTFEVDPDGKVTDGTTNGPGKASFFMIYYNGRVTDYGNTLTGSVSNRWSYDPTPAYVPSWFKW